MKLEETGGKWVKLDKTPIMDETLKGAKLDVEQGVILDQ